MLKALTFSSIEIGNYINVRNQEKNHKIFFILKINYLDTSNPASTDNPLPLGHKKNDQTLSQY